MEAPEIPFHLADLALPIRIPAASVMTDEDLLPFRAANDVLRIEREPDGELTVMSPTGADAGKTDSESISAAPLGTWRGCHCGVQLLHRFPFARRFHAFPDAATASREQWNALSPEQRRSGFAPLCPQFVIELRSPSDRLSDLQAKMGAWLRNGRELAWLIDSERQAIEIYRPGVAEPEVLQQPVKVQGESAVAGFTLETDRIWQQG